MWSKIITGNSAQGYIICTFLFIWLIFPKEVAVSFSNVNFTDEKNGPSLNQFYVDFANRWGHSD